MITRLRARQFKSWKDLSDVPLAPLTAFFGTNSSGKTSLLQLLLLMKQTVEMADRARVLHTGDAHSYVDLGTFQDLVYEHKQPGKLELGLEWKLRSPLKIEDPEAARKTLFEIEALAFDVAIEGSNQSGMGVEAFGYRFQSGDKSYRFGMKSQERDNQRREKYDLVFEGHDLKRMQGRPWPLPRPVKSYGFPDQVGAYFQKASFLSRLSFAFEDLFQHTYYLGPLRDYPQRSYVWAGDEPQDVGRRGEAAVAALLATRGREKISRGYRKKRQSVEERIAECLQQLGLIDSFRIASVAENRKDYEVWVRINARAPEVRITDVGFGVSQILPVLVLCYYVPEGSTIILEQPEIHLHPAVQAGLADVFLDAIRTRHVQIIVESHSEHLLRRFQRRIAEAGFNAKDARLYFAQMTGGASQLIPLELDLFGNIKNWPKHFFGDEFGDRGGDDAGRGPKAGRGRWCPRNYGARTVMKRVVDTNVLIVANGRDHAPQASPACVLACVTALQRLWDDGVVVLDDEWHILREYMKNLNPARQQPGVGDAFLKWVLTNQANPQRCEQVHLTPNGASFAEFPADPALEGFDVDDHKFVAVARVHPAHPPILNAVDSDWSHFQHAPAAHGITVQALCT